MIDQNEDLRIKLGSVPAGESPLPSEFSPDLSMKFCRWKTCQPKQPRDLCLGLGLFLKQRWELWFGWVGARNAHWETMPPGLLGHIWGRPHFRSGFRNGLWTDPV